MPVFHWRLPALVSTLTDESLLAQPLLLPGVSCYSFHVARLKEMLSRRVMDVVKQLPPGDVYRYLLDELPQSQSISLEVPALRDDACRTTAVTLDFQYVVWRHGSDATIAYLPALGMEVISDDERSLPDLLTSQLRMALARTRFSHSLRHLVMLDRFRELAVRPLRLKIRLPTLKDAAIEQEEESARQKSLLNEVATNLVRDPTFARIYERNAEVQRLAELLTRRNARSVLIVGRSGAGKTALVQQLARQRERLGLGNTPLWSTSGSRIVAGMTGFGMWQERCEKLVREASKTKAVMHLGNLLELIEVGKGGGNVLGVAALLRPHLDRGAFLAIVECTPEQLAAVEREDPQLLETFTLFELPSSAPEQTRAILAAVAADRRGDTRLTDEGLATLDRLHRRWATYSAAPGRQLRFLRNLLDDQQGKQRTEILPSDVTKAFSQETGLPLFMLDDTISLDLDHTRTWFAERVIGQEDAVHLVVDLLAAVKSGMSRAGKPIASLLFIGPTGVGKTEMAKSLAEFLYQDRSRMIRPSFWRTSGQRLIAGMKYLGQWESRCEQAIEDLSGMAGVLCVDDLLELVRVGGCDPGGSVAAFFQPYLERGELRIVAEATIAELDACRRLLPGFAELFQVVRIPEFTATNARRVLDLLLTEGARQLKLPLESGLADLVYRLFQRFQPYAAFPGRSVAFIRHLLDARRRATSLNTAGVAPSAATTPRALPAPLATADVLAEFQKETGLPERLLRDDLPLPHDQVLADFRAAVLGQEAACRAAAGIVTTLKTGLNDPQRPLGVLLFCGPTGVGKTEMAKALARYLFGANAATDRLLRLDMSEYAGPGAASRLMMSADGGPSDFIKRARQQPFVVVLFDEIEKAAADVHDALLGVLDEGRLTDRYGRVTTFRSAVIVMTSNVGADRSQAVGFDAAAQPSFERIVLDTFRPEFVNRLDAIVTFQPLQRETIASLVVRELESLAVREGLTKSNLRLVWDDAVIEHLANAGFDLRYGARPLQRAVERLVVPRLARWLLAHPSTRNQRITLTVEIQEIRCEG